MIDRLEDLIHLITADRNEFESTMDKATCDHPGSEVLATLRFKFDSIFQRVNNGDDGDKGAQPDYGAMSQFWNDPDNVMEICRSVDQLEKSVGKRVVGTSSSVYDEPSFSLGLTQEDVQPNIETPICKHKHVAGQSSHVARHTGLVNSNSAGYLRYESVQPTKRVRGDQEVVTLVVGRERPKRTARLGYQLRSPYMNRAVDISKDDHKAETSIWEFLWRMPGPESQVIFLTPERRQGIRALFKSLQPSGDISCYVIDCWAAVLNYEECKGSDDSPSRLFCSCTELNCKSFGFKDVAPHIVEARILTNLKLSVNEDESRMRLSTYDLVFYPIKMMSHHFLVCFDLKHSVTYVIDSVDPGRRKRRLKADRTRDQSYIDECNMTISKLKGVFSSYLNTIGHSKARIIDNRKPVRLQLSWATAENYCESGIFTMRHMETFMGAWGRKWQCGLVGESPKQGGQLFSLRKKYATKILLSDINLKREEIILEADMMGRDVM